MSGKFLTIVGQQHYYGMQPFKVGRVVKLIKEEENDFDSEAIKVTLPFIGTVGYVANSPRTVYLGTCSAGRIYDKIENSTYARIRFVTHSSVIAEIDQEACEEYKRYKENEENVVF